MIEFLREFAKLSPAEQRVFIYCAEKLPFPRAYSGDLQEITTQTGLYYQTVRQALFSITASPILSRVVKYIHSDVSAPRMVSLDAAGMVAGREMDFEEIERNLKDHLTRAKAGEPRQFSGKNDVSPTVLPTVKD
jgi:hypothetical protein